MRLPYKRHCAAYLCCCNSPFCTSFPNHSDMKSFYIAALLFAAMALALLTSITALAFYLAYTALATVNNQPDCNTPVALRMTPIALASPTPTAVTATTTRTTSAPSYHDPFLRHHYDASFDPT